jgi:hypothetical protein
MNLNQKFDNKIIYENFENNIIQENFYDATPTPTCGMEDLEPTKITPTPKQAFVNKNEIRDALQRIMTSQTGRVPDIECKYGRIKDWNISDVYDFSEMFNHSDFGGGIYQQHWLLIKDINAWNVTHVTTFEKMFSECFSFNLNLGDWVLKTDRSSPNNNANIAGMFYHTSFNQKLDDWDQSWKEVIFPNAFGHSLNPTEKLAYINSKLISGTYSIFGKCNQWGRYYIPDYVLPPLRNGAFIAPQGSQSTDSVTATSGITANKYLYTRNRKIEIENSLVKLVNYNSIDEQQENGFPYGKSHQDPLSRTANALLGGNSPYDEYNKFFADGDEYKEMIELNNKDKIRDCIKYFYVPNSDSSGYEINVQKLKILCMILGAGMNWKIDTTNISELFDDDQLKSFVNDSANIGAHLGVKFINWDVSKVENMNGLFKDCGELRNNLGKWDVSNVKYMNNMFENCSNQGFGLRNWNLRNLETANEMFKGCSNFNEDISAWGSDLSKFREGRDMFEGSEDFQQDLTNWAVQVNVLNLFGNMGLESTLCSDSEQNIKCGLDISVQTQPPTLTTPAAAPGDEDDDEDDDDDEDEDGEDEDDDDNKILGLSPTVFYILLAVVILILLGGGYMFYIQSSM